jgi:hypothetical protein
MTSNKDAAVTNLPGPGKLDVSNFTGTDVTLSWTDDVATEDRYEVLMRVDGGDWQLLADLAAGAGTGSTLSYTVSGIEPLLHSEFHVQAANSATTSAPAAWDDEAYNTRVLTYPGDNDLFSPDPNGILDPGVTTVTATIPALPRHTALEFWTEYDIGSLDPQDAPGSDTTFEIRIDGAPVYTEHYTWEHYDDGWVRTLQSKDFHNGASKTLGAPDSGTLKVMHSAESATLTYAVSGLGADDWWGIYHVQMSASLPHIQPATYYSIEEGGQDGQFRINSDTSDESLNVNVAYTGSATYGVDYDPLPNVETIPAGSTDIYTTIHPESSPVSAR